MPRVKPKKNRSMSIAKLSKMTRQMLGHKQFQSIEIVESKHHNKKRKRRK